VGRETLADFLLLIVESRFDYVRVVDYSGTTGITRRNKDYTSRLGDRVPHARFGLAVNLPTSRKSGTSTHEDELAFVSTIIVF
jgi:hypothetical protein